MNVEFVEHRYTSHGHPCCELCPIIRPSGDIPVHRCGGQIMCSTCRGESALFHHPNPGDTLDAVRRHIQDLQDQFDDMANRVREMQQKINYMGRNYRVR